MLITRKGLTKNHQTQLGFDFFSYNMEGMWGLPNSSTRKPQQRFSEESAKRNESEFLLFFFLLLALWHYFMQSWLGLFKLSQLTWGFKVESTKNRMKSLFLRTIRTVWTTSLLLGLQVSIIKVQKINFVKRSLKIPMLWNFNLLQRATIFKICLWCSV